jgi:hypothetical protein
MNSSSHLERDFIFKLVPNTEVLQIRGSGHLTKGETREKSREIQDQKAETARAPRKEVHARKEPSRRSQRLKGKPWIDAVTRKKAGTHHCSPRGRSENTTGEVGEHGGCPISRRLPSQSLFLLSK